MNRQKMDICYFTECYGTHSHAYPQILVPLKDRMRLTVGSSDYQITRQELCMVPPNTSHCCDYSGKLLVINLSADSSEWGNGVILSSPIIVPMQGQITQLVELIQNELSANPESSSIRHLYHYLYSKLMENYAAPSIRYIGTHYDLPITVNQLAEMESYNVTYYNDWFKQQTGTSPNLYLRRIRIEHAKELLLNTGYTVMEVAVMVGYSSNATFTRAFHSITGMTPKAYRNCACHRERAV